MSNILEEEIVFFILGISVIVIGLILTIVLVFINFHKRNFKREQAFEIEKKNLKMQFLEAQIFTLEDERQRMANSFHDDINPLLAALKNQIKLTNLENKNSPFDENKFFNLNNLIDKIIDHQNVAIKNLAPAIKNLNDLDNALTSYFTVICDYEINYSSDLMGDTEFSIDKLKNAYSIVLELVHNIGKHEKISLLEVHLQVEIKSLNIILKHKGKGLTNEDFLKSVKEKEGRGLSSINSRIIHLNAKIDMKSMENGAIIFVSIPK